MKILLFLLVFVSFTDSKFQSNVENYISNLTSFGNIDGTTNSQINEHVSISYNSNKKYFTFYFLDRDENRTITIYYFDIREKGVYHAYEASKNNYSIQRIIISDIPEGKCFSIIYTNGTLILFGPTIKK